MKRTWIRLWRRARRRLGPLGVWSVSMLALALLMAAWIPQLDRRGEQLGVDLASRLAAAARPGPAPPKVIPLGEQVKQFVAAFPVFSHSAIDLGEVFQSAARLNVRLLKGEYRLKVDSQAPVVAYTATFPVVTEYGPLKDFIAEVLQTLPNASMDELRMTRTDAGSRTIEAVIRFTFVYRDMT